MVTRSPDGGLLGEFRLEPIDEPMSPSRARRRRCYNLPCPNCALKRSDLGSRRAQSTQFQSSKSQPSGFWSRLKRAISRHVQVHLCLYLPYLQKCNLLVAPTASHISQFLFISQPYKSNDPIRDSNLTCILATNRKFAIMLQLSKHSQEKSQNVWK